MQVKVHAGLADVISVADVRAWLERWDHLTAHRRGEVDDAAVIVITDHAQQATTLMAEIPESKEQEQTNER